jgi:hypothetical protein
MLKCRSLYNAGLSSASCGIVVSVAYGKRTFIVHVEPQHRRLAHTSMIAGLAAALGIFWQALIPLQHDIGEVIRGRAEISPQSMLHQSGSIHQNPTTASLPRAHNLSAPSTVGTPRRSHGAFHGRLYSHDYDELSAFEVLYAAVTKIFESVLLFP